MAAERSSNTLNPRSQKQHHVYEQTLMYGQYTKDLGEFARREALRQKVLEERWRLRRAQDRFLIHKEGPLEKFKRNCSRCCSSFLHKFGEDWIFLTLLGIVMALLSFIMDYAIEKCQEAYKWSYLELSFNAGLQYLIWVFYPLLFICFSTGFVHLVGPNAIGSGIPEMKTIMRGVVLKEYLTLRTLISKMVGLCTSLGSGLLIGKEGPFVHIASIVATLLGKVINRFRGNHENESRNSDMLAAACAVGVACTFAAPIGGVLFSIEVTATYFAVRNYWRGFYAAVCGAFIFRLLAIVFTEEQTLTALFQTTLRQDLPFDPVELIAFSFIGLVCGLAGALFVFTHRQIVNFIRQQKKMSAFLQRNRFIFPGAVVFILSSLLFPLGLGQYMAGQIALMSNRAAVNELFSNFTWTNARPTTRYQEEVIGHWAGPENNIYLTLTLFIVMRFWMTALAITLPVPAGVFMPVFTIGAAFGRLVGESMAAWFPHGIYGKDVTPGGYAIVGAAALSGSVTHTISTSVIVFELTGQMGHMLPCVIAVLISNMVAHGLQLSIYDSLIRIKKLPYLPDIINPQAVNAYRTTVEDFMKRNVKFIVLDTTYMSIFKLLKRYKYRAYPLVDSADSMILLGSIQRFDLEHLVIKKLTEDIELDLEPLPEYTGMPYSDPEQPIPPESPPPTTTTSPSPERRTSRFAVQRVNSINSTTSEDFPTRQSSIMSGGRHSSVNSETFEHEPSRVTFVDSHEDLARQVSNWSSNSAASRASKASSSTSKVGYKDGKKSVVNRMKSIFQGPEEDDEGDSAQKDLWYKDPASDDDDDDDDDRLQIVHRTAHVIRAEPMNPSGDQTKEDDSVEAQVEAELSQLPYRLDDINSEDLTDWEISQLNERVSFEGVNIDPAPHQVVERASLYRVHSIFSLLNLHHAYVTNTGRLVGIVALKEVRNAIQGEISRTDKKQPNERKFQLPTTPSSGANGNYKEEGRNNPSVDIELEEAASKGSEA